MTNQVDTEGLTLEEMAGEWTVSVSDPGFLNWLNARLGRTEAERDAAIARAEAAEAQLRAMMEGEAYEWIRNHPEIDAAIDAAVGLPVDNTEE